MKDQLVDKLIAYLALFSGLCISAVAIFYSVSGLIAIFPSAVTAIIVMGLVLEIGKLVSTVWLKQNWNNSPKTLRLYLLSAVAILMLITSMGIFGFLSKAHIDQNIPSSNILAQVALIDEKIKTNKENIDVNRKAIKQLDDAVDQTMGRSTTEAGANRSNQIRRAQQKERNQLNKDIQELQKSISDLQEARAPIAVSLRKVEAEVGPIKYIAAFFYGDTDPAILERAVTWIIIIIIIVFDPLALVLLLASQVTFQRLRKQELDINITDEDGINKFFKKSSEISKKLDKDREFSESISPPDSLIPPSDSQYEELREVLVDPNTLSSPPVPDADQTPEYVRINGQLTNVRALR